MAEFRKYVFAMALVALLAGLTVPASAQAYTCAATTVPTNLRAEGMTELAGDIIIDCSGGTAAAVGTVLPQVNITISTSVALTSKITSQTSTTTAGVTTIAPGIFDEAILIADQPNTNTWSTAAATYGGPRNILNCGNVGAPDSDPAAGIGICSIIATGNKYDTYDGTPNGQPGGLLCGGGGGTLATGAYGCGRPNVFQGRQDILSPIGPQQRVVFLDVPIDQPGSSGPGIPGQTIPPNCDAGGTCHHFFRITNIRVNAANLGGGGGGIVSGIQVFADITVSNNNVLPLNNVGITNNGTGTLLIGRVNTTLAAPTGTPGTLGLVGCKDNNQATGSIQFQELIADAWRPRNISLLLTNNVAPNSTTPLYNLLPGIKNNTAAAVWTASDCLQNVPGTNYETEAAFQNSLPGTAAAVCPANGGTPSPNPPNGLSLGAVPVPPTNSAFSDNGSGTGIQSAGIATSGTRLVMNIQNVYGVSGAFGTAAVDVRVPSQIVLKNRSNGNASGVAILQNYTPNPPCSPNVTNPAADQPFCPANTGFPTNGPFADGTVSLTTFPNNQAGAGVCTNSSGVAIAGTGVAAGLTQCSAAIAFYEIMFADPGVFEQMTVPFFVDYKATVISLQGNVTPSPIAIATGLGYGPFYNNSAPQSFATLAALPATAAAGSSAGKPAVATGFPYPRFVPGVGAPVQLFSISGKCVCDLLFPYVTDGPTITGAPTFDTGIAIANTSRDPGSVQRALGAPTATLGTFGFVVPPSNGGGLNFGAVATNEQSGPVQFWYYSTQQGSGSPNFGNLGNGAQGNTQCTNVATPGQCSPTSNLSGQLTLNTGTNVPAGGVLGMSVKNGSSTWGLLGVDAFVGAPEHNFTGYIIAQASFQYWPPAGTLVPVFRVS